MSHEIRTPMNSILGFAQILSRDHTLNPKQLEHVETIARSSNHLLHLVNDILDISKIEAGKAELKSERFDLRELLRDVQAIFESRAKGKELQLLFEVDESLPQYATGDSGKLRQILVNLIGNSVKYTRQGGVAVRLRPQAVSIDDDMLNAPERNDQGFIVECEVEDTGPGIESDEIDKLFETFYQSDAGLSDGGTGLGLPICKQYVHMMNGNLTVSSEIGVGSLFRFEVQLGYADGIDMDHEVEPTVVHLKPDAGKRTILVVDDSADNRDLIAELLSPVGFDLEYAANGEEALRKCRQRIPDAVLMDMRMPVMDGYETTEVLRRTFDSKTPLIVAVTASAFDDDEDAILLSGVDAYLRKPFKPHELFEILAEGLGIDYIRETPRLAHTSSDETVDTQSATEPITNISSDIRSSLIEAAQDGDIGRMNELLKEISGSNPTDGYRLKSLFDRFDYDAMIELLEQTG